VETNTNDAWKTYFARGDLTIDPQTPHIMARFGTDFTCTRQDLVDDATWYGSDFYTRVCVPSGWDQCMQSQVCVDPPGIVDGIGLTRPPGAEPFGPRDVAIVRLAHQELAHLWRKPDPLGVNTLPTRLRQTLHCIRRGLSRKEIAQQLGVSPHTAHLHEKILFARCGVTGRTELMALIASSIRPTLLPLKQDNDFFDGGRKTRRV
jgi:DNA-binding CsgD family transcriptional regulator